MALVRRYTGDRALASLSALLFALHPYHIANLAWISGRSDPICAVFFFAALLRYDHWRESGRGIPIGPLVLFEAALLSKESAIVLPAVVLTIGLAEARRRPGRGELARGILPLVAVGAAHMLLIRPLVLGPMAWTMIRRLGRDSLVHMVQYTVAGIVPAHPAVIGENPLRIGVMATLGVGILVAGAWIGARRIPAVAWVAAALFPVLVLPALIWFREWSFFLPSAVAAVALASLLLSMHRRTAVTACLALVLGWLASGADHWVGWREASRASTRLVEGLVKASLRPAIDVVVVANMPCTVRGMPVGIEFDAAIELSGGRAIPVEYVTYLDYSSARADDLDGVAAEAIRFPPPDAEVRLAIPASLYSRNLDPGPGEPGRTIEHARGRIHFSEDDRLSVTIFRRPGVAAYVWRQGRLEMLF